jgi:hypothetical protein
MARRTLLGGVLLFLVALFCVATSPETPPTPMVPDPGVRIGRSALACPSLDPETGLFYLYYEDEDSHRQLVSTSEDGLLFGTGRTPTEWRHDPRVLVLPEPDGLGLPVYRRYLREPDSTFISESSSDGVRFTRDPGVRYNPRPEDLPVGVYDHFVDSSGGVVLLYIGDMQGVNNVRRASSAPGDNGWTFDFEDGDPLRDAGLGGGPNSYVDQKSIRLPDGRRRLFVMKRGSIYSFMSEDEGVTFTLEPGPILRPEDFREMKIRSLHDPWPVLLPDGRVRIYLHGSVDDPSDLHNVILSATEEGD